MNKAKPKSINPQPPAGNALEDERSRKPRAPKSPIQGDVLQPPSSTTNEDVDMGEMGDVSPEERQRMIEEAAYYCAQRRQTQGGGGTADDDWAEAEAQIDRLLKEQRNRKQD